MVIGDHTETHPVMAALPPAEQAAQIIGQAEQVEAYGAPFPRLYRPPYDSVNRATFSILRRLHMLMVLWTVDTNDYLRLGVPAIVLMHDAGGDRSETIAALPAIVHKLRARGYRLVTIPQLILDDPPTRPTVSPFGLGGD